MDYEITFDVPQLFSSDSSTNEKTMVKNAIRDCLDEFRKRGEKVKLQRTAPTQITFGLPRAFSVDSTPLENAKALQSLMSCLCKIDEIYFRCHRAAPELYASGVVYDRTTVWDSVPALYSRLYGDCKSLTAALIGQYRAQGIPCKPVFRFAQDGDVTNYHILVQTEYEFEDPSKALGMELNENLYFAARQAS